MKWLQGKKRDVIAQECKLSGGSVSSILERRRAKDREFDLLRVEALLLNEQNLTVESFAPLIRLRNLIISKYADSGKLEEVEEEKVETLVEGLCVSCFDRKVTIREFGDRVYGLCKTADRLGIDLYDLHLYVDRLAYKAAELREQVDWLQILEKRFLKQFLITKDIVEDIASHGPYMLGAYLDMKARSQQSENERIRYKDKFMSLQIEIQARKAKAAQKRSLKKIKSNLSASFAQGEKIERSSILSCSVKPDL
jgi:hypothetical protein